MDIEHYKNLAQQKVTVHQKYLKKLKQKKPKNLDVVMQETHDQVFDKIDCLECANCCKTTGPLLTEKDIERIAKHLKIKPQQFTEQYLYKDEDNDWVFKELPCPFLGADNYCLIYEVRPKACREYPHTDRKKFYQINHLTQKNTLICPAVYEVLEEIQKKLPL